MAKTMSIEDKRVELETKIHTLDVIEDLIKKLESDLWWRCDAPSSESDEPDEAYCVYRVFDEGEGHYRFITKDSFYANDARARLDIMEKLIAMI